MSQRRSEVAPIATTPTSLPQPHQQVPARRPARSKTGCNTCRVRKVRCDETRPRCSHCFRLNLECRWRPSPSATAVAAVAASRRLDASTGAAQNRGTGLGAATNGQDGNAAKGARKSLSPQSSGEEMGDGVGLQPNLGAMDQMFDYASFMWDAMPAVFGQFSPEWPAPAEPALNSGLWRVSISMASSSGSESSLRLTLRSSTTVACLIKLAISLWTRIWARHRVTI